MEGCAQRPAIREGKWGGLAAQLKLLRQRGFVCDEAPEIGASTATHVHVTPASPGDSERPAGAKSELVQPEIFGSASVGTRGGRRSISRGFPKMETRPIEGRSH